MADCALLAELLGRLLDIPVVLLGPDGSDARAFAQAHCFAPGIQTCLTAEALRLTVEAMKPQCLYELQDPLGIRAVLFRFEGQAVLAGPFVTEGWEEGQAAALLARHGLPAAWLVPCKRYYCSYRVVPAYWALHCIQAATAASSNDKTPRTHRILRGMAAPDAAGELRQEPPDYDRAVQRYRLENELIRRVRQGDLPGALDTMARVSAVSDETSLPYLQQNHALTSANILRTLLRKAAEAGGVHPAVVDALSQKYAQKAYALHTAAGLHELCRQMAAAFCQAVLQVRRENYSPAVRRAADYILLHLSTSLKLAQIAQAAQTTPNHLSHIFKAETGQSVSGYIAAMRCQKAAELLRATSLPIQEISAYVGYLDNNYFVKVFKARYGVTPTGYRRGGAPAAP